MMIKLEEYDYFLPKERIAQYPVENRDCSKLIIINNNTTKHRKFYQIINEIEEGDVIIVNNSKVTPSNLKGRKETGGHIECLFLREIDPEKNRWECLLKGRKLRVGGKLLFLDGQLIGIIRKWLKFGEFIVEFSASEQIKKILQKNATITLPPYIKALQEDITRYQTIYASIDGSIAAPTAGFHFTPELIQKIRKKGAKLVEVTLHVGYSTFMPLNNDILIQNKMMDSEYFAIPSSSTVEIIEECQQENHQLIAVGTTTLKAIESATDNKGKISKLHGWSDLFIAPNYSFKSKVSHMITNFHMPKSSPLLMICAFAGKERIFHAYQEALSNNYRFYTFGDAMFVNKE